jgi:phosphoribosyl-AMP cyclohydrolase
VRQNSNTEKQKELKHMNATIRIPDFEKRGGLVPVIVQEERTGSVLMLVYTRKEEFLETLEIGEAVFFSTSRKKRWKKGEEKSGNILVVSRVLIDCDGDALLYVVRQTKAESGACHTGKTTCFFRSVAGSALEDDTVTTLELAPVAERLGR